MKNAITKRKSYSDNKLSRLKSKIRNIRGPNAVKENLCIYATGSYGRMEAYIHSDVDLFFLQCSNCTDVGKIDKTLLDAQIIYICREQKFPEFSNDGMYLEIHNLSEMLADLGSPNDDHRNHFTARMLLLLESKPIYNEREYDSAVKEIINTYYRDYHDHEVDFKPVFLVNDIIRFWKTLCLNYEHRRNRKINDATKKAKSHLKNLKLKFSRLLTCYSFIAYLMASPDGKYPPAYILSGVKKTPIERLEAIGQSIPDSKTLIQEIRGLYCEFLKITEKSEDDSVKWIANTKNRNTAFNMGRTFSSKIYKLLQEIDNRKHNNILKFIAV